MLGVDMALANIYFMCFLSLPVELYLLSYNTGKGIKTAYFLSLFIPLKYSFYNIIQ